MYIINDDEVALVITHNTRGYGACEIDDCLLDEFGNVELPQKYLHRLAVDENQEITISLPFDNSEVVIENLISA